MEMELESIMLPGIDPQRPIVIAGPCSAETEEQVMETAKGIADKGIKLFRAGIWKPRTKPGGFEGIGAEGLQWLKRVKKETGMYVATEVATKDHVFEALKAGIDVLWIGARTTVNPFAVQEIADALKGVDVRIWSCGSALSNVFMEPVSVAWVPSTAVSALTIRRCTATSHSGIFLSSFAAVCQTYRSSAIQAISEANVNWSLLFASRRWT